MFIFSAKERSGGMIGWLAGNLNLICPNSGNRQRGQQSPRCYPIPPRFPGELKTCPSV